MADDGFSVPTDAFVEILLRLPTSSRRRLRLVCKHWRDVVNERTPERQVRTKILAFIREATTGRYKALVVDGQDGRSRHEWTFGSSDRTRGFVHMVGTCNGLLCLKDSMPLLDGRVLSTITVANPITGEKVALPREPKSWAVEESKKLGKYSFGYHPTTGKYKVVHVSHHFSSTNGQAVGAVLVVTLGDLAWHEVPVLTPNSSYNDLGNVVTVDGSTYWLNTRADRVMALDLKDECVTSFKAPPIVQLLQMPMKATCHLTNANARLGIVVMRHQPTVPRVDVWVLEGGGHRPRWSKRYSLLEPSSTGHGRWITTPHFTHGEYILSGWCDGTTSRLYRSKVGDSVKDDGKNAQLWPLERPELIMYKETDGGVTTFPYAETEEPLPMPSYFLYHPQSATERNSVYFHL